MSFFLFKGGIKCWKKPSRSADRFVPPSAWTKTMSFWGLGKLQPSCGWCAAYKMTSDIFVHSESTDCLEIFRVVLPKKMGVPLILSFLFALLFCQPTSPWGRTAWSLPLNTDSRPPAPVKRPEFGRTMMSEISIDSFHLFPLFSWYPKILKRKFPRKEIHLTDWTSRVVGFLIKLWGFQSHHSSTLICWWMAAAWALKASRSAGSGYWHWNSQSYQHVEKHLNMFCQSLEGMDFCPIYISLPIILEPEKWLRKTDHSLVQLTTLAKGSLTW